MTSSWRGKTTHSPEETIQLGAELAKALEPGDVFSLNGELAAGKTTFMKGVLKGLNFENEVTSPTFTLINEYESNPKVIHIDCYREQDLNRWQTIGIQEYFESGCIVFVEWAEFIKPLLPDRVNLISFSHLDKNSRKIEITEK